MNDSHLKDQFMASTTMFTSCLYVKRVIFYDLKKDTWCLEKWKVMTSLIPPYLKTKMKQFFFNFVSENYVLLLIGTENLVRLQRDVSELWRGEKKVGAFNAPPSKSRANNNSL